MLKKSLKGKITNVYIDPDMALTAPPISEGTSMGGLGVLPEGSRIKLNAASKIVRAFTYWEKIDDIDLSAMATDEAGNPVASFYWANVSYSDNCIIFSGDQTSGYKGGSEFFDVDINAFAAAYPRARYLIFCNNTYSSENFSECVCRAGYMIRDINSSGEIYEPKTVKSSFTINCDSRAAYLFAIDLKASEIVWLNIASAGKTATVISNDFESVNRYLTVTRTINLELLFEMMAAKRVTSPDDADVIVSDKPEDGRDGKTVIHSYSFEEIFKLIN
jgi:hypothetical protein